MNIYSKYLLFRCKEAIIHLEEASDSSSSTLVPVHPSHDATSLDVCSTGVVGDTLETPHQRHIC